MKIYMVRENTEINYQYQFWITDSLKEARKVQAEAKELIGIETRILEGKFIGGRCWWNEVK